MGVDVVVCVQSVKMPASRRRRSRFAGFPDWSRVGETLRPWSRPRDGFSVAAARSMTDTRFERVTFRTGI